MSVLSLLSRIKQLGIGLQLMDDQLKITAPKTKLNPLLLKEIKEKKQEIVAFLQAAQFRENGIGIKPVEKKEYYPISSTQKRIYLVQHMNLHSTAYNMPLTIPLPIASHQDNNKEKLVTLLNRLIMRHESLRTCFREVKEEVVQVVRDTVEIQMEVFTQTDHPELFFRPFDLSKAPLLRVGISYTGSGEHILMVDMHHIISDAVSSKVLVQDFAVLYGEPGKELPGLKLQYKDFAEWQANRKENKFIEQQQVHWMKTISGEIPVLHLPTDFPRPTLHSFAGNTLHFELNQEQTLLLEKMAKQQQATLFMVLLAFYYVVLYRISGQEDIIAGIPVAGRRHNDLEQTIGMFVNILALRNFPRGEKCFPQFLKEVKEVVIAAFENQEYPLEDLFENVKIERDLSRNPLFDVIFNFMDIEHPTGAKEIPAPPPKKMNLKSYGFERKTSKFDISLIGFPRKKRLFFNLEYCSELFKSETMHRLIRYFQNTVAAVLENEHLTLADIDIIPFDEKQQLLVTFNETTAEFPGNKTIDHLFTRQVKRTPDHIALIGPNPKQEALNEQITVFDEMHLSYEKLQAITTQLQQVLKEKGVKSDTIVGIIGKRSLNMIIGILGILKAGGTYLPIDPNYPQKRINYMLTDSKAKFLLAATKTRVQERFVDIIDISRPVFSSAVDSTSTCRFNSDNLAYIIYTSGSTGKPKGVMVSHRSAVNFIYAIYRNYNQDFHPFDNFLCLANFCFDVSVGEIFMPLVFGASIVLLGYEKLFDPQELVHTLLSRSITFTYLPTALLIDVYERLKANSAPLVLNKIFVGVEPILDYVLENYLTLRLARNFQMQVLNTYGPTEATVCVTTYRYVSHEPERKRVPIGTPLSNLKIFLLDKNHHLVPRGVTGELCIQGVGLARGYLNNPEQTAEKFLHPSAIYKTGDLARWLPDGNIEFIGRIDLQVKIRGYRVEPGEIESHLLAHKDIRDAIVIVRDIETKNSLYNQNKGKETYLCAYITSKKQMDTSLLIDYLSEILPYYMIPSYFVFLDKIPLNPNGKIDHKALPAPVMERGDEYIAPETPTEKKLVKIWSEVLEINEAVIGINANFFQLGGHSLKALRLTGQIHKEFNQKIPLSKIFESPTIKNLAQYINNTGVNIFVAIEPTEKREYYSLSASQNRLYNLYRLSPQSTAFNATVIRMLDGNLDRTRLERTFKQLFQRHESLRTCFEEKNNEPVQRIYDEIEPEVQYHVLSESGHQEKEILQDFKRPFVLEKAPLVRMGLVKRSQSTYILMLDMHHIITDGLSMEIFVKEAVVLYNGGEPEPLKLQYKDFSQWQNKARKTGMFKEQEEYWRQQFADGLPKINLPFDFKRPPVQTFEGERFAFEIDASQTAALKKLGLEEDATPAMVLTAVYYILLSKLSSQEDIVVGQYISGRSHIDLEHIIGLFINALAIRCYPSRDKSFRQFLREVKTETLIAFENQDIPLNDLMELVLTQRKVKQNLLFNASFIFQNQDRKALKMEGIRIKPYKNDSQSYATRVDLLFDGSERGKKIIFIVEYSSQLFRRQTIEFFVTSYKHIVSVLTKNPDKELSEIQMSCGVKPQTLLSAFQDDLENE